MPGSAHYDQTSDRIWLKIESGCKRAPQASFGSSMLKVATRLLWARVDALDSPVNTHSEPSFGSAAPGRTLQKCKLAASLYLCPCP